MNSEYISNLRSKNPLFASITEHLLKNPEIRELSMPEMQKITGAKAHDIHEVMTAVHQKGAIGRYIIGRKGNPNRFTFEHYPQDIAFASIDPVHSADKIPTNKPGRPSNTVHNDAGKPVAVTDTRARYLSVRIDETGMHVDISNGVQVSAEVLAHILSQLH